jgi:hypothetical protein
LPIIRPATELADILDPYKKAIEEEYGHPFQGGALIPSGRRKIKEGKEIRAAERALP